MKRKLNRKFFAAIAVAFPVVGASAAAMAFPFGNSWMQPSHGVASNQILAHDLAGRAGGGGIWATGSKMDKGLRCSHCHIDTEGLVDAQITFNPPLTGGTQYSPGQTYQLSIALINEQKLPMGAPTLNGFALTFEGTNGQVSGVLRSDVTGNNSQSCPANYPATAPAGTSYVYGNCDAVVFVPKPDTTAWSAGWTAPAAGAGAVKFWYAVVDGDQNGGGSLGDDVKEAMVTLDEGS